METKRLKTIDEFLSFINNSSLNIIPSYYRGQANSEWDITPSLARNKEIHHLLEIEKKLLEKFQHYIKENKLTYLIPRIYEYDDSWIIIMAAQHYGLPTRLLDFTHDKIIAVLFAVANIEYLNKDGALIIYFNSNGIQQNFEIFKECFTDKFNESFFIQAPKFGEKDNNELRLSETRKILQGSKFFYRDTQSIYDCLSADQKHSNNLIKIIIPKELKLEIIKEIINKGEKVYDLFAGKNELDHFAALLKFQFSKLNDSNINEFLRS